VLNRSYSVAVLGAGHGGLALAGYLGQRGHRVALWNRTFARIAPVAERGGICLTAPGATTSFAPIDLATSDIGAVLSNARRIVVAVPASAHADVARECAPYLRDGQTVLLLPGRTCGALAFQQVLRESGCRAQILLGEANTFPFAARSVGPASAVIYGAKSEVMAAALPARRTAALLDAWRPILPMLAAARSVLHTGFANLGAILHPVITLLNAERIRGEESFDFYTDGVTPSVAATLAGADAERLSIARAYDVATPSLSGWIAAAYGHHADSIRSAVGGNPAYVGIKAPTTLIHRYLLEDVPTGLIPMIELGQAAGLGVPRLRRLVEQARAVLGRQQWDSERSLEALGLDGLDMEAIQTVIEDGFAATPARVGLSVPSLVGSFGAGWSLVPQV
jgi:opine dehydrogenase